MIHIEYSEHNILLTAQTYCWEWSVYLFMEKYL